LKETDNKKADTEKPKKSRCIVIIYHMENNGLIEISHQEYKDIQGGGPIARFIERFLCGECRIYPTEMYVNTASRRGI
jgi:hypothetical protein